MKLKRKRRPPRSQHFVNVCVVFYIAAAPRHSSRARFARHHKPAAGASSAKACLVLASRSSRETRHEHTSWWSVNMECCFAKTNSPLHLADNDLESLTGSASFLCMQATQSQSSELGAGPRLLPAAHPPSCKDNHQREGKRWLEVRMQQGSWTRKGVLRQSAVQRRSATPPHTPTNSLARSSHISASKPRKENIFESAY